jgi:hypothetical protein
MLMVLALLMLGRVVRSASASAYWFPALLAVENSQSDVLEILFSAWNCTLAEPPHDGAATATSQQKAATSLKTFVFIVL